MLSRKRERKALENSEIEAQGQDARITAATIMFSRAVNVKIASSLETGSFIHALRHFLCRQGPVRQLRRDQGTNFVGERRELKEALQEMKYDHIRIELLKKECDYINFKMNTTGSSHMGGIWE